MSLPGSMEAATGQRDPAHAAEVPDEYVKSHCRDLVAVLRFYAVTRRYGYLDPLIYGQDPNQIREVLVQALREYHSYLQSSNEATKICDTDIRCLEVVKQGDSRYEDYKYLGKIFGDVIHIRQDDTICLAPVMVKRQGNQCEAGPAHPTDSQLEDCMKRIHENVAYARALAGQAIAGARR